LLHTEIKQNLLKMNLCPESIYAIAAPENILKGRVEHRKGILLEGRSWVWAKSNIEKLNSDTKMVLLIANASFIKGVEWAAIIDEIEIVDKTKTIVHFSNLIELRKPYPIGNLIKLRDGERLDRYYRRSYVPCKLPQSIAKELKDGFFSPSKAPKGLTTNQRYSDTTTVLAQQIVRTTQDKFRGQLLKKWKSCMVTGFKNPQVLIASHIVPWSEANTFERQDINNGLLLVAHLDQLFDRHLISFDSQGFVVISSELSSGDRQILGLSDKMKLNLITPEMKKYLQRHRKSFNEKLAESNNR